MVDLGHKSSPVRRDIRTLVVKKLLRLGPPYPRSCMDKPIRMHTKMHTNEGRAPRALQLQGL
jgi:hypothetical protein